MPLFGVIRPAQTAPPSPAGPNGHAARSIPLCSTRAETGGESHQRAICCREATVTGCQGASASRTARRSASKGGTCSDVTIGARRARARRGG